MPYMQEEELARSAATLKQLLAYPVNRMDAPGTHYCEDPTGGVSAGYKADESEEAAQDSDEDPLRRRIDRMSFNAMMNFPMAPDGRMIPPPPPSDDWFTQTVELAPVQPVPARQSPPPVQAGYPVYPTEQPQYGYDYSNSQNVQYIDGRGYQGYPEPSPFAWSPSGVYNQPIGYRAPVLQHRDIQNGPRLTPTYGFYGYPAVQTGPVYPPASPTKATKDATTVAFSRWYADQVIELLVKPGQYRPGAGGSSDEVWGVVGREKDAFFRVGRPAAYCPKQWGRMGISETPPPGSRAVRQRVPEMEPVDPWNVLWCNEAERSSTLVAFIHDMMTRMTFSPTAVVAAVWYLTGLGLHRGDGAKGSALREFMTGQRWSDLEAIEKRIAALGLLLAGKWLDDNSFLTKSWVEVTGIPVAQIDQMERIALADYHFSLYLPTSAWTDHVNNLYTALLYRNARDEAEDVVLNALDEMVTEAREIELVDHKGRYTPANDRRVSEYELPAAGEQAISRDWGTFARSYAINEPVGRSSLEAALALEQARAEQAALAMVDQAEVVDEQEEDGFLDYDGAKPWLPSMSEMRRTASNSSAQSFDSVAQWRAGVSRAISEEAPVQNGATAAAAYEQVQGCAECARRGLTCSTAKPAVSTGYPTLIPLPIPFAKYKETGVYLEPGIAVMRPPTAPYMPSTYILPTDTYNPAYGYTSNMTGTINNANMNSYDHDPTTFSNHYGYALPSSGPIYPPAIPMDRF